MKEIVKLKRVGFSFTFFFVFFFWFDFDWRGTMSNNFGFPNCFDVVCDDGAVSCFMPIQQCLCRALFFGRDCSQHYFTARTDLFWSLNSITFLSFLALFVFSIYLLLFWFTRLIPLQKVTSRNRQEQEKKGKKEKKKKNEKKKPDANLTVVSGDSSSSAERGAKSAAVRSVFAVGGVFVANSVRGGDAGRNSHHRARLLRRSFLCPVVRKNDENFLRSVFRIQCSFFLMCV